MSQFYQSIIQSRLLYGGESWVLNKKVMTKLQSFHHCCARYITGKHIREEADGSWTFPPSAEVLKEAGLQTIQEYIRRRRETVKPYLQTTKIFDLCANSSPLASNNNQSVWWKLDEADLITSADA